MKLNRSITEEEFEALGVAGLTGCTMTTISLPLDGPVVTQLDVDTEAANLTEAIQAGLDAVRTIPDLEVGTLEVPPQPTGLPEEDVGAVAGENGHAPVAQVDGAVSNGAGLESGAVAMESVVTDALDGHLL